MMDDFQPGDLAYNQGYTEVFLVMDVAFDEHGQMWLWLADRNCDILALPAWRLQPAPRLPA
jgi:hypothetical protein